MAFRCLVTRGTRRSDAFSTTRERYLLFGLSYMYTGLLQQQIIYSSHPFIVLEGENVCGAFAALKDAEVFIIRKASYSAVIYTNRGSDWVIIREARINPLLGSTTKKRKIVGGR